MTEWIRNTGLEPMPCDKDAQVLIRYRDGSAPAEPVRAGSRHWLKMPGVSPHAKDIVEWART